MCFACIDIAGIETPGLDPSHFSQLTSNYYAYYFTKTIEIQPHY